MKIQSTFKPISAIDSVAVRAISAAVFVLFGSYFGTSNSVFAQNLAANPPATSSAPANSTAGQGTGLSRMGDGVKLDFVGADIAEVARTFGVIMGRNMVVDPRVKGQINLSTERTVSIANAYNQYLAALRMQGFTVVEASGIYKVVPESEAKLQGGAVNIGSAPNSSSGNQILTQIFRLNHENANNLVPILRPLISPNNTINVNPGNNSLVITDYADNMQRLAKIIAALDISTATDLEIFPLRHAIANDLAPLLQRLTEGSGTAAAQPGQVDSGSRTSIIAEPRANAIIVRAGHPARVQLIKQLIEKLDQAPQRSANGDAGNIYVVHLKNADATKLATTLRAAIAADAGARAATPAAAPAAGQAGSTNQPSTGGQIQADPATNSLIITAPEPQYRQIRAVIDRLDQRRAQVFVESLIAEVSSDKAADFGIQWQGILGKNGNSNIGLIGTNFGTGGNNILTSGTSALPGTGLNIGWQRLVNGVYVLSSLAKFLETSGDGNVLSTPNLLTLDNEEAKIVIGQNVPFVTGQFTNTGASSGNSTVNPFQTIERKDVGLTLRVKPQISENGQVKLQIFQEVSSVDAASKNAASGIITNKRSIESNVMVDDGGIIVLGGLLSDEYAGNQDKVPGLSEIPFIGGLFKSESRSRRKTNLMVFLRPIVVRDAAQGEALALDRYDLMRSGQIQGQPTPSSVLKINEAPVSPAQTLPPSLPGATPKTLPAMPAPLVSPIGMKSSTQLQLPALERAP